MADRSLKVFIAVLFGIGGLLLLLHAWTIPAALAERLMTTGLAVAGWGFAWLLH